MGTRTLSGHLGPDHYQEQEDPDRLQANTAVEKLDRPEPEAQGGPLVRTPGGDEGLDLRDPGYGE